MERIYIVEIYQDGRAASKSRRETCLKNNNKAVVKAFKMQLKKHFTFTNYTYLIPLDSRYNR
jgi:hypothetical protein